MEPWIWAVLLLLSGISIVMLEVFIPSGGVLGVLAGLCFLGGIGVGFLHSMQTGIVMLGVTSLAIPLVLALAIHWWPHTPLGRRILNPPPENPDDVLPDTSEYRRLKSMIGQRGKATCDMLPSGTVRIDHRLYEAVSLGMPIDAGDRVEVVEVRMNRLVVRPCTEAEPAQHAEVRADEDLLSRPFDSLGLEDPLAE